MGVLGFLSARKPEIYEPREEARLGRQAIQASAWNLLEREQALLDTAANARLSVAVTAVRSMVSPSFGKQLGLQTENELDRALQDKSIELGRLTVQKYEAVKDFFLTLRVLVPLDPGLRGIETADRPSAKLIERAREWIIPVPIDAYQLDRDYYEQQSTNK